MTVSTRTHKESITVLSASVIRDIHQLELCVTVSTVNIHPSDIYIFHIVFNIQHIYDI